MYFDFVGEEGSPAPSYSSTILKATTPQMLTFNSKLCCLARTLSAFTNRGKYIQLLEFEEYHVIIGKVIFNFSGTTQVLDLI